MVELVIVYCLAADNSGCVERRPALDDVASPIACMMAAQPLAAEYLADHPKYKLSTWRCEMRSRPERAA